MGLLTGNLFAALPAPGPAEEFRVLWERAGVWVERILSRGHTTPPGEWYDQPADEWVAVLSGVGTAAEALAELRLLAPDLTEAEARSRVSRSWWEETFVRVAGGLPWVETIRIRAAPADPLATDPRWKGTRTRLLKSLLE